MLSYWMLSQDFLVMTGKDFKVICWSVIGFYWSQAHVQNFSLSKKLYLVVLIISPGSSWFSEHDLVWPFILRVDFENYSGVFVVFILRIGQNRPYKKYLLNLVHLVITGKSQTSSSLDILTWTIKVLVWDFIPAMTTSLSVNSSK